MVPGAQEGRRHRADPARRRARPLLQRRVFRRLLRRLRADRRRQCRAGPPGRAHPPAPAAPARRREGRDLRRASQQRIFVEVSHARLATLGIAPTAIARGAGAAATPSPRRAWSRPAARACICASTAGWTALAAIRAVPVARRMGARSASATSRTIRRGLGRSAGGRDPPRRRSPRCWSPSPSSAAPTCWRWARA